MWNEARIPLLFLNFLFWIIHYLSILQTVKLATIRNLNSRTTDANVYMDILFQMKVI